jgi:hypothetical protein
MWGKAGISLRLNFKNWKNAVELKTYRLLAMPAGDPRALAERSLLL